LETDTSGVIYPSDVFVCSGEKALTTVPTFSKFDYEDIAKSVNELYEKVDSTVSENYNPRS